MNSLSLLTALVLTGNKLTALPKMTLSRLVTLNLAGNQLVELGPGFVFPDLVTLDAGNNLITSIDDNFFCQMPALKTL
jgi:Leucine-rich repeat (LRR) protein